jgi:L-ribulose-5-phosphate 4-epimerase
MEAEGYIKYKCDWRQSPMPQGYNPEELLLTRNKVFDLGLIGFDEKENVSFGNISQRYKNKEFIISGTQTGNIAHLLEDNLSWVKYCNIYKNNVIAGGPSIPSSEAITHGWLYSEIFDCGAVIHVHSNSLWKKYFEKLPTTSAGAEYGTPEMALEIERLYLTGELTTTHAVVMGGHQDGLIFFGGSLDQAFKELITYSKEA